MNILNSLLRFGLVFSLFLVFVSSGFSDPSAPPPPPVLTSYTYYLMDEFTDCGVQGASTATFCDDYYLRRYVRSQGGSIIEQVEVNVCGKDARCTNGQPCSITNPSDNNAWITKTLSSDWVCPKGYGLAHLHTPGSLYSNFDTVSVSQMPPFKDISDFDIYFNSYIPACVNRIPMMNFNPKLIDSSDNVVQEKVGLYARHETLDYEANAFGGVLKNFEMPSQTNFREVYTLSSDLKTYRMWAFRERFVEALQRTVVTKNLRFPQSINLNNYPGNRDIDFDDIYFSRDYMLGKTTVHNVNNNPVGSDIHQDISSRCNFDVHELGISAIGSASDLDSHLRNANKKAAVMNVLGNTKKEICSLGSDMTLVDVSFVGELSGTDFDYYDKVVRVDDINDLGLNFIDDALEFKTWAQNSNNWGTLTQKLLNENLISRSNPAEEVEAVYAVLISQNSRSYYDNETNTTVNENYYEDNVSIRLKLKKTFNYDGLVGVDLDISYATTTESSWNWRALESLTLNQLGKCLYNWDACLFNSKTETGTVWTMNEVADLGYGPRMDSLAYVWSKNSLESEYNFTFGYHFDGARGSERVDTLVTSYRDCSDGNNWISDEGYYSCVDGEIYKCHFGLSADEIGMVTPAFIGDTLITGTNKGLVCRNSLSGPKWSGINCNI